MELSHWGTSLFPSRLIPLKPGNAQLGVSANLQLYEMYFVSYPFTYSHCVLKILP